MRYQFIIVYKIAYTVPISDFFFELVLKRRKKCVEHGIANNPFQTCTPPAQTEDGENEQGRPRQAAAVRKSSSAAAPVTGQASQWSGHGYIGERLAGQKNLARYWT